MSTARHFSNTYAEARTRFVSAAQAAGATITSHQHPLRGQYREKLFCDVATLGNPAARKAVVAMSGVHGGEGYAGSGVQIGLLADGIAREIASADTKLVLIHAINPHGFSHDHRVTEDGVDLCRNFVDFSKPLPANPQYAEIVDAYVPEDWFGPGRAAADAKLALWIEKHGNAGAIALIAQGQYDYWHAPFFGGQDRSWSNRLFERIVADELGRCANVACVDFHTGLGPYGIGQLLCFHEPGGESMRRAKHCWGDRAAAVFAGESIAYKLSGGILPALEAFLPRAVVVAGAYEFGTRDTQRVFFEALPASAWFLRYADHDAPYARQIKALVRDAFYVEEDRWKELVFEQGCRALLDAAREMGG